MMAGVQGSGKTTACAKLALHLKGKGRRPLLVAADLERPAAVEQLRTLGREIGVPVFSEGRDPVKVAKSAREGGGAPAGRRRHHRHRRAAARRRRHDEAGAAHPRRGEAASRADGVRRHDRSGRRGAGARVHARGRHDRVHPHEARRRRARRRGALDHGRHGPPGVLRRHGREAGRSRAVLPRPDGRADPGHGRRADADRQGAGVHGRRRRSGLGGDRCSKAQFTLEDFLDAAAGDAEARPDPGSAEDAARRARRQGRA